MDTLLQNLRTICVHHCDATVGEDAAYEIERLMRENAELRDECQAIVNVLRKVFDAIGALEDDGTFENEKRFGLLWVIAQTLARYDDDSLGDMLGDAAKDSKPEE